jgi:putative transposase
MAFLVRTPSCLTILPSPIVLKSTAIQEILSNDQGFASRRSLAIFLYLYFILGMNNKVMSRNLEFSINEFYHIYNRGVDKRIIFIEHKDYERFIALLYLCNSTKPVHMSNYRGFALNDLLSMQREKPLISIGAYCLMPNHFHILVKEIQPNGISSFMHRLITAYTMYFNGKYKRIGPLVSGNFKAIHAIQDEYLKYLISYIHLNPIKLIEPKWKEKGISSIKSAKFFLINYTYSSYLDYCLYTREEKNILSLRDFPDYFQNFKDFNSNIIEWLNYIEAKP